MSQKDDIFVLYFPTSENNRSPSAPGWMGGNRSIACCCPQAFMREVERDYCIRQAHETEELGKSFSLCLHIDHSSSASPIRYSAP